MPYKCANCLAISRISRQALYTSDDASLRIEKNVLPVNSKTLYEHSNIELEIGALFILKRLPSLDMFPTMWGISWWFPALMLCCDRSVQPLRHHDHQYCEKQQIERVEPDIYFVSNNSKYGWHQGTTCIGTRHLYTNDRL